MVRHESIEFHLVKRNKLKLSKDSTDDKTKIFIIKILFEILFYEIQFET